MIFKQFRRQKYIFGKTLKAEMHLIEQGKSRTNLRTRFPDSVTKWNKFLSVKNTNIKTRSSGYGDHDVTCPQFRVVSDLNATYGTDISCNIRN